jgi:hypothetical protein
MSDEADPIPKVVFHKAIMERLEALTQEKLDLETKLMNLTKGVAAAHNIATSTPKPSTSGLEPDNEDASGDNPEPSDKSATESEDVRFQTDEVRFCTDCKILNENLLKKLITK